MSRSVRPGRTRTSASVRDVGTDEARRTFPARTMRPIDYPTALRPTAAQDLRPAELLQDLPRDHQPLDLRGALADLADLGVAEHALHRVVLRVAVAAVDLDGLG